MSKKLFFLIKTVIIFITFSAVALVGWSLHNILNFPNAIYLLVSISLATFFTLFLGKLIDENRISEKRKDEFISIASHELKTPITTIKGYTQILNQVLRNNKNQQLLFYISKMDDQLNRLTKLVNDLLDVSKIQSSKLALQKEKADIKSLISGVVSELQLTNKHQIIFETSKKDSIATVDKHHLHQVLVNLISNAVKYSPKSDRVIVRLDNQGKDLVVSIEDFGIGISKKDQSKVFTKFYRAENRIRQSFSGLGLGLYISSEIIKQHQGSIWVNSTKGKGTTFSFKLPKNGE